MRKPAGIIAFASLVEIGTGLALIAAPAFFATLLLGTVVAGTGLALLRCFAIAVFGLGLACWPGPLGAAAGASAFRGMLAYNMLIALFLAYLSIVEHIGGVLLWPAVALHVAVAASLVWTSRKD